ncbi:MAG: BACON domain-containing protein [Rikenellaceae bacterium]
MKNKFWLLLALFSFVAVSCEESETVQDETITLSVFPTSVTFTASGGDKTLTVACSSTDWTVSSNQSWVTAVKTDETTITLTAGELFEGDAAPAQATITVSAGSGDSLVEKTALVSQSAFVTTLTFGIEFTNTTTRGTDFTVTPSDEEGTYCAITLPTLFYDGYPAADLILQLQVDGVDFDAIAVTGTQEFVSAGEDFPGSDYIVLVFGWEDGEAGDGELFDYTTLSGSSAADCTFNFSVTDLGTRSATIDITPSSDDVIYVDYILSAAEYDSYIGSGTYTFEEYAQSFTSFNINYFYSDLAHVGASTFQITSGLSHNTEYYVWAVAVDGTGTVVGTVGSTTFTTEYDEEAGALEPWVGTWTLTSASSVEAGTPLSVDIVVDYGYNSDELYFYGIDLSSVRWYFPLTGVVDADGYVNFASYQYLEPYDDGTYAGDIGYFTNAYLPAPYNSYYIITGDYTAMAFALTGDGVAASAMSTGTISDGTEFTVSSMSIYLYDTTLLKYLSFGDDTSLGFQEYEALVGPFTMTKISDDTTLPSSAQARAKSSIKIAEDAPFAPYAKARVELDVELKYTVK